MRGEIEAAETGALPHLIELEDLRGDLHMHTTETDGHDTIAAMAEAARDSGLQYMAITDHSQSLAMANGLDEPRALAHAARIRALDAEGIGIRLLAGIECDIRPDGSLDLADDCLAALDLVVASVHSGFNQDRHQMTERLIRALENPNVDILGHPTGRLILKREPYGFDLEAVIERVFGQQVSFLGSRASAEGQTDGAVDASIKAAGLRFEPPGEFLRLPHHEQVVPECQGLERGERLAANRRVEVGVSAVERFHERVGDAADDETVDASAPH